MLGKLKVLSGNDVCKILEQNGFLQIRQKGSHLVMQKKTGETTITVPVPNLKEIKIGTPQSIIRQSQLSKTLFEI
jgi:predicted RNA binding protein YcfA (HicA-like mRNA interferase family)